jgi:hypothetical protein
VYKPLYEDLVKFLGFTHLNRQGQDATVMTWQEGGSGWANVGQGVKTKDFVGSQLASWDIRLAVNPAALPHGMTCKFDMTKAERATYKMTTNPSSSSSPQAQALPPQAQALPPQAQPLSYQQHAGHVAV